jgi:hypothetical protein
MPLGVIYRTEVIYQWRGPVSISVHFTICSDQYDLHTIILSSVFLCVVCSDNVHLRCKPPASRTVRDNIYLGPRAAVR